MNIQKETKKNKFNIDYHLVEVLGAGVTINPIAFLVIQSNGVKLMPVNHTSSIDKLLDYMPDLIEKTNNMMNRHMQSKKEETQKILKEMQKNSQDTIRNGKKNKKQIENKIEEEVSKIEKTIKNEKQDNSQDETYEFEYDETMEDE